MRGGLLVTHRPVVGSIHAHRHAAHARQQRQQVERRTSRGDQCNVTPAGLVKRAPRLCSSRQPAARATDDGRRAGQRWRRDRAGQVEQATTMSRASASRGSRPASSPMGRTCVHAARPGGLGRVHRGECGGERLERHGVVEHVAEDQRLHRGSWLFVSGHATAAAIDAFQMPA